MAREKNAGTGEDWEQTDRQSWQLQQVSKPRIGHPREPTWSSRRGCRDGCFQAVHLLSKISQVAILLVTKWLQHEQTQPDNLSTKIECSKIYHTHALFSFHSLLRHLNLSRNLLVPEKGFLSRTHVQVWSFDHPLRHILEDGEGIWSYLFLSLIVLFLRNSTHLNQVSKLIYQMPPLLGILYRQLQF